MRNGFTRLTMFYNNGDPDRVVELLRQLQVRAHKAGVELPFTANTPYINTISRAKQPPYPGNREIERLIKSVIRWNAMAMVVKANKNENGYRRTYFYLCLGGYLARSSI